MNCLTIYRRMVQISHHLSLLHIKQTSTHLSSTFRISARSYLSWTETQTMYMGKAWPMLSSSSLIRNNIQTQCICQFRRSQHCSAGDHTQAALTDDKPANNSFWQVTDDGKILVLRHQGGKAQRFHSTWLRYNCQCNLCVEPDSRQRTVEPSFLEPYYTIKHIERSGNGGDDVILSWHEDDHVGRFSSSYLERHGYSNEERRELYLDRMPSIVKGDIPTFQYDQVTTSEEALWNWLTSLNEFGMTLIKDVPTKKGMVGKVAEKISNVIPTIYEKIFDVMATPHPINIAYSSENLSFHMDLAYYESPPGIQLLHCLRFDECVRGGETVTVDAWHVAVQLRNEYSEDFDVLTRVPATFQKHHFKRDNPVCMTYQRPHIVLGHTGQITNINWSPPFEGPLCVAEEDVEPYYRAYHRFATMLENSETRVMFRMNVGDLLAFNNRRILHSRKGFDLNGGQRHLQGCYINIDEFKSKVQVLSTKYNEGRPAKDVFNQSVI